MKVVLVISHLLALGAGYLVFQGGAEVNPESAEVSRSSRRPRPPSLPADENPFFHATSDDYRKAFTLILEEGTRPDRFLIDWVNLDPEAALLEFANYYDLQNSDSVLRGVQSQTGSRLAHALTKHHRELQFVEPGDVSGALGQAIGILANENPAEALELFSQLTPGMQSSASRSLLGEVLPDTLGELFDEVTTNSKLAAIKESSDFWEDAIYRAWRVLSPEEFQQLFQKLDAPAAIPHLTHRLVSEATRFNKPERFLEVFQSLPPAKQEAVVAAFHADPRAQNTLENERFREAAVERGMAGVLERLGKLESE